MLQGGVQLTLIPELRATGSGRERLRLVRHEALLLTIAMAGGSLVIWLLAPPIAHWFLSGRYDLSAALMTAAIVSGVLKVVSAFTLAIVVAVAQEGDLRVLSVISWASSGLSIIAAFCRRSVGLVGVLYGISSGWLIRSVLAAWMAMPHLRQGAKYCRGERASGRRQALWRGKASKRCSNEDSPPPAVRAGRAHAATCRRSAVNGPLNVAMSASTSSICAPISRRVHRNSRAITPAHALSTDRSQRCTQIQRGPARMTSMRHIAISARAACRTCPITTGRSGTTRAVSVASSRMSTSTESLARPYDSSR